MPHVDITGWLNAIHQGDCLELLAQLPSESVDLVFTSPPYNLKNSTGNGSHNWSGYDGHSDDMPHGAYVEWQRECLRQMLRVLKPDGAIFYNHMHRVQNGEQVGHRGILDGFPLRQAIIWHRSGGRNFNPGYFLPDYEVVYMIAKPDFRLRDGCGDGSVWRIHQETCSWIPEIPTFPVDLPQRAISATSAEIVLDPFMGSGSTAVAAVLEGRSYIGFEQSPQYCETARLRLASCTLDANIPIPLGAYSPPDIVSTCLTKSARLVLDYITDAETANGRRPVNMHQQRVADDLDIGKRTVARAVGNLKRAGLLQVAGHGQSNAYSTPRNGVMASDQAPRNGVMASDQAPRNGVMASDQAPRNGVMASDQAPRNGVMASDQAPRNGVMGDFTQRNALESSTPPGSTGTGTGTGFNQVDINPTGAGTGVPARARENVNDAAANPNPQSAVCPAHPQDHFQTVTTYKPLVALMEANGDEITYCHGSGRKCSWVYSRDLGTVVASGRRRLDALGIEAAYYDLQIAALPKSSSEKSAYGPAPWEI